MTSGIRIWGANGALQMDENSFTVRVVYSGLIQKVSGENRVRFVSVPGITPETCIAICLPSGPWTGSPIEQNGNVSQYDPQVVANGVNVWFGNRNMPNGVLGFSLQRLIVMRYR